MTSWYAQPGEPVSHGFHDRAWMRSLCGQHRWTAALELATDTAARCPKCLALDDGVVVVRVPARDRLVATSERRKAIARASSRRRWRRVT